MDCCEPLRLCNRCFETELARLAPTADSRGEQLAVTLAAALVPEPFWVASLDRHHRAVRAWVADLARDPRLLDRLADRCAAVAVRKLGFKR